MITSEKAVFTTAFSLTVIILGYPEKCMQQTIDRLRAAIKDARHMTRPKNRRWKPGRDSFNELATLEKTDRESARSISGFADVSAFDSLRRHPDDGLRAYALDGLKKSIAAFEASHPYFPKRCTA
jgi:hypothetical protein